MIKENYDRIDGKIVKDNTDLKHYTNVFGFHKIVKSEYLRGSYYTGNTYTYGKEGENGPELCLVRSDRTPDNLPNLKMSPGIGDIKFCFDSKKLAERFKIKPINEYRVQVKHYIRETLIKRLKEKAIFTPPVFFKKLEDIELNCQKWDKQTALKKADGLKPFLPKSEYNLLVNDLTKYIPSQDVNEKFESRVQAKKISLKFVDKILIPDYLKDFPLIQKDFEKLKKLNVPFYFYQCKYPKDKVYLNGIKSRFNY